MTADSAATPSPVVLVTGAGSGIGRAVALAYAAQGARLVLFARSPGRLAEVAEACSAAGGTALVSRGDVLDRDDVRRAFGLAQARFGPVAVVVHSVSSVAYGRLEQVPAELWERAVDTTVHGTANVARAALLAFGVRPDDERGRPVTGTLAVVGSVLSQVTVPYMSSYVTGKWAVRGLVRALQQEARDHPGLRIVQVHPGAVDTPIYRLAATYAGRAGKPPPPVVSPEYVAERVLRAVDGGRHDRGAGRVNALMRFGFTATPRLYDVLVGPLMRAGGLQHRPAAPTEGNVTRPSEEAERLLRPPAAAPAPPRW